MTKRLKRIAPVQAGKMLGLLQAVMSLLFVPFFLLAGLVSAFAQPDHSNPAAGTIAAGMMIALAVLFPVIYGVMGFIFGIIGAAIYNLFAKWVGGIEFEVEDVADEPISAVPTASL